MTPYPIEVYRSDEDGAWIAVAPDLLHCASHGATPHEAVAEVEDADRGRSNRAAHLCRAPHPRGTADAEAASSNRRHWRFGILSAEAFRARATDGIQGAGLAALEMRKHPSRPARGASLRKWSFPKL